MEGILLELGYTIEVGTGKFVGVGLYVLAEDIFTKPHSKTYSMLAAQLLAAKLNVAQLSQFIPGYSFNCLFDIGDDETMTVIEAADEADLELSLLSGHLYSERVDKYDKERVNILKSVLDDFNNEGCPLPLGGCPCDCFY